MLGRPFQRDALELSGLSIQPSRANLSNKCPGKVVCSTRVLKETWKNARQGTKGSTILKRKRKPPHLSLEEHRHEHVCQVRNLIFEEEAGLEGKSQS